MIVFDSSVIVALIDRRDDRHGLAAGWYGRTDEPMYTTSLVLAEVDLVIPRAGEPAVRAFRSDVVSGAYPIDADPDLPRDAAEVAEAYPDLGPSLTDASLVVLADRLGTRRIATFDERHFRAIRPLSGGPAFTLVPLDGD